MNLMVDFESVNFYRISTTSSLRPSFASVTYSDSSCFKVSSDSMASNCPRTMFICSWWYTSSIYGSEGVSDFYRFFYRAKISDFCCSTTLLSFIISVL